jgi:hypothetical protein
MFVELKTLFWDVAPRDVDDFSHYSWLCVPVNVLMFFAVFIDVNSRKKQASCFIFSYSLPLSVTPLVVTLIMCVVNRCYMVDGRYFLMIFTALQPHMMPLQWSSLTKQSLGSGGRSWVAMLIRWRRSSSTVSLVVVDVWCYCCYYDGPCLHRSGPISVTRLCSL